MATTSSSSADEFRSVAEFDCESRLGDAKDELLSAPLSPRVRFESSAVGAQTCSARRLPQCHMTEGASRPKQPQLCLVCSPLETEIYQIGSEASRNALRHPHAHEVEVELRHDKRQLGLRVRDNGNGIDATSASDARTTGHFGLHVMRERAEVAGESLHFGVRRAWELKWTLPFRPPGPMSPRGYHDKTIGEEGTD